MRRMRGLIGSVEEDKPDEMTERACFDLPATDVTALEPETALDERETTSHETGNASRAGSGAAFSTEADLGRRYCTKWGMACGLYEIHTGGWAESIVLHMKTTVRWRPLAS